MAKSSPGPRETASIRESQEHPLTPVSFSAAAGVLLEKIRALHADVPNFKQPMSKSEQQRLISNAGVDDDFLDGAAVMLESSPALRSVSGVEPESLRETVRFAAAYIAVVDELAAFSRAVAHTILVRRDASGKDARAIYDLAKALSRKPEGASLLPHIAQMKKKTKRTAKSKKADARVTADIAGDEPQMQPAFKAGKDL
jgi:predicted phage tail protein